MEWVEVAYTAVIIGLPAIVTGTTAYLMATKGNEHDFDKEYFKRRLDLLEHASGEIEECHKCFEDIFAAYIIYLRGFVKDVSPTPMDRTTWNIKLTESIKNMERIRVLMGRMRLLGMQEGAECLDRYTSMTLIANSFSLSDQPVEVEDEVIESLNKLESLKSEFYSIISDSYRDIKND